MIQKTSSIFVIHLGCSKNQVDAEQLVGELLSVGFQTTDSVDTADYIIINTCGFIEPAKEESIETILSQLQNRKKGQKVIVSGCLSQRYGKDLASEMPEVDYWIGTYKPGELLTKLGFKNDGIECAANPRPRLNLGGYTHHAYIKIAEGCNRKCAFCAIPGIRGNQISRSIKDIVEEAKQLESQGIKELTLIAQDTTYFGREKGKKGGTLQLLLEAILSETKIPWIRMLYWYPEFIDDSLLELMAKESRLCKYIDMPIQHASDSQLKLMKRHYRKAELRELLLKIREKIPNITLRTTVLVGFPGETHEDFEELMDLIQEVHFEHLGGFVYSPEEGTPAEKLTETPVDEEEARVRLDAITELQESISLEKNEALIGKEIVVLIDEIAEESEYHFIGRTEGNALDTDDIVKILEGDAEPGNFYKAIVVDVNPHELICNIIKPC